MNVRENNRATDSPQGVEEICSAIPHRPPMLLVDQIVSRSQREIVCSKTFRSDEFFFQGHYPDFPIVPGVILCECAAQAGAILLSQIEPTMDGIPVLSKLENARFKRMVRPGESIEIRVTLDDRVSKAFYMSANVNCGGMTVLRCSFVCAAANSPDEP
jgi:3-hydroxyacyl-[acyl-carrier-protein] dehydratase